MSGPIELSRNNLYILVAVSVFLAILLVILGFVLGQVIVIPEPFPSAQDLADQVEVVDEVVMLPEEIEKLSRKQEGSSGSPNVPEEGMTFYEKLVVATPSPAVDVHVETFEMVTRTETASGVEIPATPTPDSGKRFIVQVSSVKNKSYADELESKLKKKGYPAYISRFEFKNKRVNYRVRVGPYPTRDQAVETRLKLEKQERLAPVVYKIDRDSP